jgi:adenine-specific DNA-methyltransferase
MAQLIVQCASRVRFAGLTPALDPPNLPTQNSKEAKFLMHLLNIGAKEVDAIVLDFFAGSGSTGHALMQMNANDNGKRRFILVQLPEPIQREDYRDIAEITKERLRRSGNKVRADNPNFSGDTGFRAFKLDTSNIRAWNPDREDLARTLYDHIDHILPDRSEDDILYELLLKLGLDLCVPVTTRQVAGKAVSSVGGGVLFACLAQHIGRGEAEILAQAIVAWRDELAPAGDVTCVFRDSAFADDVTKTNLAAILAQSGIQNVRSL